MIVVSAKDLTKAYGTDGLLEKCPVNPEIISFLQTRKSVI